MDERLFGSRIRRILAIALMAIMFGTGIGVVTTGVTVTVSRNNTVAMEDGSTGGVRPGAFKYVESTCDLDSVDESASTPVRSTAAGVGWLVA